MFREVSTIANMISLLTVGYLFYVSYGTKCFKLGEWYLSIIPLFLAAASELIAIFIGEENNPEHRI